MDDMSVVENHLDVPGSFTKVGENARLMLYAENPNGAIRVVDKETNYIYGSSFAAEMSTSSISTPVEGNLPTRGGHRNIIHTINDRGIRHQRGILLHEPGNDAFLLLD
jgi:hypothetical protein